MFMTVCGSIFFGAPSPPPPTTSSEGVAHLYNDKHCSYLKINHIETMVSIDQTRHCIQTYIKIHVRINSTVKVIRASIFTIWSVLEVTQRVDLQPTCTIKTSIARTRCRLGAPRGWQIAKRGRIRPRGHRFFERFRLKSYIEGKNKNRAFDRVGNVSQNINYNYQSNCSYKYNTPSDTSVYL